MMSERLAGYIAGLQAGYAARCREEADEWEEETSHRVYLSGQFYDRPTAAERLAEREATLREGHAAGLHDVPRPACPLCSSLCVLHGDDCRSAQNGRRCSGLGGPADAISLSSNLDTGERWHGAIDWLLNSRHTADPDIQGPFWAYCDGLITRDELDHFSASDVLEREDRCGVTP
jgi:hypothetical protein